MLMSARPMIFVVNLLLLAILACNLSGGQPAGTPDLAATITAQALLLSGATDTPGVSGSMTPSVAEVRVTASTNCRTGPSTAYDLVLKMNPGQTVPLVGKDTQDNYWIINNPSGGTCWLWGQYAAVGGKTAALPEFPDPPI